MGETLNEQCRVNEEGPMGCKILLYGKKCKVRKSYDVEPPLSGKRVSNTWVTCLLDGDTSWKRLLIPNVIYGLKEPLKLR